MSSVDVNDGRSLSRDIGLFGAVSTVVAGTLGAGLFVTLGTASSTTGPSVILVVVLSGLLAMSIALNYGWMATIFPGAAGSYAYVSRTFDSRLPGFVVTWSKWLGYMAADAVLAIGFGSYLQVFYPSVDPTLAGFGLLTALFLVNLVGSKSYSVSQNAIFGFLILSILVLVGPGLLNVDAANYQPFFTGGFDGFVAAAVPLFYAYIGIAVAGQMGAEVKNPSRNLPLAMAGGTAILIFLYVLTAAVIYGVVGDYTVLANSARPLSTAAEVFLGDIGTAIVGVGGLLATASSVHAVMAAGIKMPYSWAWDEVFPKKFSAVSDRFGTPHWSLLTLYVVAAGLTFWSTGLSQAIAIATFSYLIAYAAVSITVLYVLYSRTDLRSEAGFSRPSLLTVTGLVGSLGAVGLLTEAYKGSLSIYVPWVAVGLVVFGVYWYRGQQKDHDVEAILGTLPGVPSDEYNPSVRGVSDD
ncbi:amino acid permease [Haloferax sp. Atlit-6N]|uniref:Cationic amino acid transporter n=1 Tax=Haloferax gibbonsii (strain ATCC 33959 / DSM 4427 / JCM 8863 / NBRC 102184 / NCIMB 2188 / Ma 2.38) TaxID=1227459 RepID=M0H8T5_HALGM|nr:MULTISPECIES: APC family permease [Haloferax]ELZ80147.1 cationic amino acid transporter [Haloferax gibbonsii ATCC 33959]REA03728.1 amino acid permease [Haloferax sp. Atlit-6N]